MARLLKRKQRSLRQIGSALASNSPAAGLLVGMLAGPVGAVASAAVLLASGVCLMFWFDGGPQVVVVRRP
jgi:hypothetical protein